MAQTKKVKKASKKRVVRKSSKSRSVKTVRPALRGKGSIGDRMLRTGGLSVVKPGQPHGRLLFGVSTREAVEVLAHRQREDRADAYEIARLLNARD
jgi:hypothetical protein